MSDEPLVVKPPLVRQMELEAIRMYRAKFPDGALWQELDDSTRHMWVVHAEKQAKSIKGDSHGS